MRRENMNNRVYGLPFVWCLGVALLGKEETQTISAFCQFPFFNPVCLRFFISYPATINLLQFNIGKNLLRLNFPQSRDEVPTPDVLPLFHLIENPDYFIKSYEEYGNFEERRRLDGLLERAPEIKAGEVVTLTLQREEKESSRRFIRNSYLDFYSRHINLDDSVYVTAILYGTISQ